MKRYLLVIAILLVSLSLLASCAMQEGEQLPRGTDAESTSPAADAPNGEPDVIPNGGGAEGEADTALDNLGNDETIVGTEQATETETETETESETEDYIIIADDDTDTSMVPSEDESVGDEWELGGVPLS